MPQCAGGLAGQLGHWVDPEQGAAVDVCPPGCVMAEGRLELLRGGDRQILQEGDVLFVASQIHWDGTNLIFKSRGNVTFREGRRGEAFIKCLR